MATKGKKLSRRNTVLIVGVAVVLLLAVGSVVIYTSENRIMSLFSVVLILLGLAVGMFFVPHTFESFEKTAPEIELGAGEEVILETKSTGGSTILFPSTRMGFIGKEPPMSVNLYLTNLGIIAEPSGTGAAIFYVPLFRINQYADEQRLLAKYIRIFYLDEGVEKEVLLFTGSETDRWMETLDRLLA